ncbi:MAG: ABC transporter permease subunit [Alphaproteobacteria bacterium]|nr:ABC transporter permease subunit [Alphaproteobacteria bacterium]
MKPATRLRIVVLVAAVAAVELSCRSGVIGAFTMIAPSQMVVSLWELLASGRLHNDIARTLTAVCIAFGGAVTVGALSGAVIHALPRLRRTADPLLAAYYSVPVFVFYPMFIVMLGLNDRPKIMIGFLYAVAAMTINTLNGLDRVSPVLLKTARMFRMGWASTTLSVVLPSAAPYLFTGVKLAIAYSFIGVVGSEFILSTGGLGYQIGFAYHDFNNKTMYALILFILGVVLIVNMSLHAWEKVLMARRGLQ